MGPWDFSDSLNIFSIFLNLGEQQITVSSAIEYSKSFPNLGSMDYMPAFSSRSILNVFISLLYSTNQFVSTLNSPYRPEKALLYNIRLRSMDSKGGDWNPPRDPAIMGVLVLYIIGWQIWDLHEPSTVSAAIPFSALLTNALAYTVRFAQPQKSSIISPLFFFWNGWMSAPIWNAMSLEFFSWFTSVAPPDNAHIERCFKDFWPHPINNLPAIVQIQVLLTLLGGLYLTFRNTDSPEPIKARILKNGEMQMTSERNHLFEIYRPEPLDDFQQGLIDSNHQELLEEKVIGYYGPASYDTTLIGLGFVFIALISVFSSWKPYQQNPALHVSVPLNILIGALAVFASVLDRNVSRKWKFAIFWMGMGAVIWGVLLGRYL